MNIPQEADKELSDLLDFTAVSSILTLMQSAIPWTSLFVLLLLKKFLDGFSNSLSQKGFSNELLLLNGIFVVPRLASGYRVFVISLLATGIICLWFMCLGQWFQEAQSKHN